MEQVENFEENSDVATANTSSNARLYQYASPETTLKIAESPVTYGKKV